MQSEWAAEFGMPGKYRGAPVVVLGDVLTDFVYQVDSLPAAGGEAVIRRVVEHPGGAGLNTSVGLSSLGVACRIVGPAGEDAEGRRLREYLGSRGVGTEFLRPVEQTGYVIAFDDAQGERTMFSHRASAAEPLVFTPELEAALERAPLVLLSGYGLQNQEQAESYLRAARRVKAGGGLVAYDPTPLVGLMNQELVREVLAVTDILLPNEREAAYLSEVESVQGMVRRLLLRVGSLGLKLGAKGSLTALGRRTFTSPARQVQAVDTTGAGDAFNAGFLAAVAYGLPPEKWGEWGNALAAKVVAKQGASL